MAVCLLDAGADVLTRFKGLPLTEKIILSYDFFAIPDAVPAISKKALRYSVLRSPKQRGKS